MNARRSNTGWILALSLMLCVMAFSTPMWGQHAQDDAHEEHDEHEGQDDDGILRLDPAVLEEFGIRIERAEGGELHQVLRLPGEVVFNADRVAHVTPTVSGIVQEVRKSVGDRVEAGEVMAILSSRELAGACSEFLAAKARLALAKANLARNERLLADRIGTERQILESRQAAEESRIALNLAEQNLHALGQSQAQVDTLGALEDTVLNRYELTAPLTGIVIARELTRGEVVSVQPEVPPFIVADLSSVWVNLTVHPRDLARVRAGSSVTIEFGHGIPGARGTIAFVSPAVDERSRTATARIVLENPDGQWRPGLFITGHVALDESARARVILPRTALQTLDDETVVFIEADGGLTPRPVKVGRTNHTHVEIVEGLNLGDRYVAANGFALKAELGRASLEHAGHAH